MPYDKYSRRYQPHWRHIRLKEVQAGSDHLDHATAVEQQEPQHAAPLTRRAMILAWAAGSVVLDQVHEAVVTCQPAQATAAGVQQVPFILQQVCSRCSSILPYLFESSAA